MAGENTALTLTEQVGKYYKEVGFANLKNDLVFYKFADQQPIPRRKSDFIQRYTYTVFAANTTALTEGTVPSAIALSGSTVTAQISDFGDYVNPTERLTTIAIGNVLDDAVRELSYRASKSLDTLTRNIIGAGGTAMFPSTLTATTQLSATSVLDAASCKKAVRNLLNAGVRPHSKTPGKYVGIVHPYTAYDLQAVSNAGGWSDAWKYDSSERLKNFYLGAAWGIEFFMTQNLQTSASDTTVYYNVFMGNEALMVSKVAGEDNFDIFIKGVGSAGSADPMNQLQSVAYKFRFGGVMYGATRAYLLKTGATA